ncbi:radical SAM protein [Candidatus Woesearchaeota archaeon]|nr:radical SAM protein [Candidatus Woesearchaeota archaeon]
MKQLVKITEESGIPLIGTIMFGIIDRGTNLLQIRPTTICPLNCPFCSTDAGKFSKTRQADYGVELEYLLKWVKEAVKFKKIPIEANIDSVGEPMSYPDIAELTRKLLRIKGIYRVSVQTNGFLLTKEKINRLAKAGLHRINLSINSLDKEKSRLLSGNDNYGIKEIKELAEYIVKNTNIELLIAPVWLPNINDKDIEDIIRFAKTIGAKLGIQKYEIYKYSRKIKGADHDNWWKFYKKLEDLENKHNIKLKISKQDFDIVPAQRIPTKLEIGEKVNAKIVAPGWLHNQMLAVANSRCITINNCNAEIGKTVNIKILENKNNIYIGEQ